MIKFPKNWQQIGRRVTLGDIDYALRVIIKEIDCVNLSLSGGIDSSLLLYYLLDIKGEAKTFTVANDKNHPDIAYSHIVLEHFENVNNIHIEQTVIIKPGLEGDSLVKAYYQSLKATGLEGIIAGDCIDELACGYYSHQDLKEETYRYHLERLQPDHLIPLNDISGDVNVYIPYGDDRIAKLFYSIPLLDKVSSQERKLFIRELAIGKIPEEIIERRKYGLATSWR